MNHTLAFALLMFLLFLGFSIPALVTYWYQRRKPEPRPAPRPLGELTPAQRSYCEKPQPDDSTDVDVSALIRYMQALPPRDRSEVLSVVIDEVTHDIDYGRVPALKRVLLTFHAELFSRTFHAA